MHPPGQPIVVFRPDKARSNEEDETFTGNLNLYDELNSWVTEKCVPLVREITFENAEELTEEGIPFLILFHKPDDNESVKKFNDVVRNELISEKSKFPVRLQYHHLTLKFPFLRGFSSNQTS
jgi:endoplasmic reticulum resident protein 44